MKNHQQHIRFSKSLVALAVLAACTPVLADDAEVAQLTQPSSSITVGGAGLSGNQGDRAVFGQYNGLRGNNAYLLLDLDMARRDNATGTTFNFKANNLGLENRDVSFSYERQGNWKIGGEYSELVHREIRTINTGMQGAGTASPTVTLLSTPGSGQDLNLKLKRVGAGITAEKWLSKDLQLELSFKNEDKSGSRLWGTGYACAAYVCTNSQTATNQTWALLLMPEPVDTTTKQLEAKLNYHFQNLNVTAGYYGSYFTNANGSINPHIPNQLLNPLGAVSTLSPAVAATVIAGGGTSLQNVLQAAIALPPDNQAHQFYVSGNYRFTPSTNATFKYAYTHATQDKDFAASGLTGGPAGVNNLGGVLDSTVAQLGLTARPLPKLSLLANVKYERKVDRTPEELYNVEGGGVSPAPNPATVLNPSNVNRYWYNYHINSTKVVGKVEASYQLPLATRATVGVDYNTQDRPVPLSITEEELAGLGAVRAKNTEVGWRVELRRSMSDTLTGAVSYGESKRRGGDWTSLSNNAAFVAAGLGYGKTGTADQFLALSAGNAFPMNMTDIDREKIKLSANYTPNEVFEVQLTADARKDTNATPFNAIALGKGWRESTASNLGLDASFAVSDKWKLNAFASQGSQIYKINHSTGYMADLNTRTETFGLGLNGKINSRLDVGAQVMYINDATRYGIQASTGTTGTLPNITATAPSAANLAQVAIGVPDVRYETTAVTLTGKYAIHKNGDLRLSALYQRTKFNEWSWVYNGRSFVYQDNSTVGMKPEQSLTYVGLSYIYRFQ